MLHFIQTKQKTRSVPINYTCKITPLEEAYKDGIILMNVMKCLVK